MLKIKSREACQHGIEAMRLAYSSQKKVIAGAMDRTAPFRMPPFSCCRSPMSEHPARLGLLIFTVAFAVAAGACSSSPPIEEHPIADLGHIEVRRSDHRAEGVVIGATQGWTEPDAAELATSLSDHTGAGLVIAYGFRSKRIPVAQPLVHLSPVAARPADGRRPGSVYSEFGRLVQSAADGPVKFMSAFAARRPKVSPTASKRRPQG